MNIDNARKQLETNRRMEAQERGEAPAPDLAGRIARRACEFSSVRHLLATPMQMHEIIARTVREEMAASPELAAVRAAVFGLDEILTCPAAEYVPAIAAAFKVIDELKDRLATLATPARP